MYLNLFITYVLQASMNLPADKARLLKQYDDEKKWDLICDQVSSMILYLINFLYLYLLNFFSIIFISL